MSRTVFLNGTFTQASEAQVSIWDGGWLHGAGLFETMRAYHGRIFRQDAHLERLMASAHKLLFPVERPDLPLTADFDELLERNGLTEARVRLTVSAGPMIGVDSDQANADDDRPSLTVCATALPVTPYAPELFAKGMTVSISPYKVSPDDPVAGHKCTCYLPRLLALRDAQTRRCGEALWFNTRNLLSEGSISNAFLVRGGGLATPPVDTPVLPGITRAVVIELASAAGVEVEQKHLNINDLLDADEVLLTNSIMEIMPVCRVEKHAIGTGKPGPVTRRLAEGYKAVVEKECKADGNEQEQG
jgi:branched-chain amino acid aminotransferase